MDGEQEGDGAIEEGGVAGEGDAAGGLIDVPADAGHGQGFEPLDAFERDVEHVRAEGVLLEDGGDLFERCGFDGEQRSDAGLGERGDAEDVRGVGLDPGGDRGEQSFGRVDLAGGIDFLDEHGDQGIGVAGGGGVGSEAAYEGIEDGGGCVFAGGRVRTGSGDEGRERVDQFCLQLG